MSSIGQERENFLKALASRGPGKRQIKPTDAIFHNVSGGLDDDEEDEDFNVGPLATDDSEQTDDESEEEEEKDQESDEEKLSDDVNGENQGPGTSKENGINSTTNHAEIPLICTICMNLRKATKGAEIIQCDKCGLAVHEACYAADEQNDDSSVTSSSSTEPWFCEPCIFGLNTIPYCELCPNRFGAFKKADIGGGWVHLICALYTPGMSFGDVEHLTAVSWQELDYKAFGRKSCAYCVDKLDARTGVSVQCEAGLCRTYYHVTCAQKLGLLIDTHSDEHGIGDNGAIDANFLYCKKHNHTELLKNKKEAYSIFLRQENCRMINYNRPILTSRQEFKRRSQLQNYLKRIKKLENVVVVLPSTKMLHSSPEFLDLFAEKSELLGLNRQQFVDQFIHLPTEQIPFVAPAFDSTFVRYVTERETDLIPEEQKKLEKAVQKKEMVLNEQKQLDANLKALQEKHAKIRQQTTETNQLLNRFCNVLYSLSNHTKKTLAVPVAKVPLKNIKSKLKKSPSSNLSSPKSPSANSPRLSLNKLLKNEYNDTVLNTSTPNLTPTKKTLTKRPNILSRSSPKKLSLPLELKQLIVGEPLQIKIPHGSPLIGKKSPKSVKQLHSPRSIAGTIKILSPKTKDVSLKSPLTEGVKLPLSPLLTLNCSMSTSLLMEEIRVCKKCDNTSDQHLLIYCSTCKRYFHIGCLDPPLKRMPVFKKNYLFECSDCACPSSSSESVINNGIDSIEGQKRIRKKKIHGDDSISDFEDDLDSSVASRRKSQKRRSALESMVSRNEQEVEKKKFQRFSMDLTSIDENDEKPRKKRKYMKRLNKKIRITKSLEKIAPTN